jgi:hypothetical protein
MRCAAYCVGASRGGCGTLRRTAAQVVDYCKQTTCRHVTIAGHFGEKHKARDICDAMCDACTSVLGWPHRTSRPGCKKALVIQSPAIIGAHIPDHAPRCRAGAGGWHGAGPGRGGEGLVEEAQARGPWGRPRRRRRGRGAGPRRRVCGAHGCVARWDGMGGEGMGWCANTRQCSCGNVPAGCLGRGLEYEYGDDDSGDAGREPTFEETKKQMFGSRPRAEPKKGTARAVADRSVLLSARRLHKANRLFAPGHALQ